MTTSQTYGSCHAEPSEHVEYLTLAFSPLSTPLRSRWRNNGLSADFLSDYVNTFLPAGGDVATERHQKEISHAVSYIANELLENAMKYHEQEVDIPIRIDLELTADRITVSATNGVAGEQAQHYKDFVEQLLQSDAGDLLIQQLERSANGEELNSSCLGLLTMINDYGAQLGWRFDITAPELTATVTTSAVLSLKNLQGALA